MNNAIKALRILFCLIAFSGCDLEKIPDLILKAAFQAAGGGCEAPCPVTLTNTSEGGATFLWNFGDGTTSTLENPGTHTYNNGGTFTITLIVTNETGVRDTTTSAVTIASPAGATPNADFNISNGGCTGPCTVSFTNNSTNATTFTWNFGDGSPVSTGFSPSHAYTDCGDYIVTLVAVNGATTDTLRKPVSINCLKFEKNETSLGTGVAVVQTANGGYSVVGTIKSGTGNKTNIYLYKLNADGTLNEAAKEYGGLQNDFGADVLETAGGVQMILGTTTNESSGKLEAYLVQENVSAQAKKYGMSGQDVWAQAFIETSDQGYMIVGYVTDGTGKTDIVLIRTDANKTALAGFPKKISLPNNEEANGVVQLNGGGFAIVGTARETANQEEIILVFTNANGDMVGTPKYFGGGQSDYGNDIILSDDGTSLTIVGTTYSFGAGDADVYLTKTDLSGNVTGLFPKFFGGTGYDQGSSIDKTADGGFVITGGNNGLVYLIKTNANGETTGTGFAKGLGNAALSDQGYDVQQTTDGGYIICGFKDYNFPVSNGSMWILKTDKNGNFQ